MGSLAAGGAAAMGTGAFEVQARNRGAEGTTVQDNNAYLRLLPNSQNGYQLSEIESGGDGELDVTLNKLNSDSITQIDDVFVIRNEGTGPVNVQIVNINNFPSDVTIERIFVSSGNAPNGTNILGSGSPGADLAVGEQIGVGIKVDVNFKGTATASGEFDVDAE